MLTEKFKSHRQSLSQLAPGLGFMKQSGRLDSNQRPFGPEPNALAKLSYAPDPDTATRRMGETGKGRLAASSTRCLSGFCIVVGRTDLSTSGPLACVSFQVPLLSLSPRFHIHTR